MKQYKNYIFDLYGTLIDIHTNEENQELWDKLAQFYGYQGAVYDSEELQASYARLVNECADALADTFYCPEIDLLEVFRKLYEEKGVSPSEECLKYTAQTFRTISTEYIWLYRGVIHLLKSLRDAGRKVYLLTNAQHCFTYAELQYLDLLSCFDDILISSDYQCKKPDKHFYKSLLHKYHLHPKDCLMIGNDMRTDIAGANAVGMDSYYIHSNLSPDGMDTSAATYRQMHMDLTILEKKLLDKA